VLICFALVFRSRGEFVTERCDEQLKSVYWIFCYLVGIDLKKRQKRRDSFLNFVVNVDNDSGDDEDDNNVGVEVEEEVDRWTTINFGDSNMVKEIMAFIR